jgi:hypothetical protein
LRILKICIYKMSLKGILIIGGDFVLLAVLCKLIFKDYKEVLKAFRYFFTPDIVSMLNKDYNSNFNYTHKILLILGLLLLTILTEIKFL